MCVEDISDNCPSLISQIDQDNHFKLNVDKVTARDLVSIKFQVQSDVEVCEFIEDMRSDTTKNNGPKVIA